MTLTFGPKVNLKSVSFTEMCFTVLSCYKYALNLDQTNQKAS